MLIIYAPQKIVTHAKTHIKMFWCYPVSFLLLLKFFGFLLIQGLSLPKGSPTPPPPCLNLALNPKFEDICLFYLIILLLSFKNMTTMIYYLLRASYSWQPTLANLIFLTGVYKVPCNLIFFPILIFKTFDFLSQNFSPLPLFSTR